MSHLDSFYDTIRERTFIQDLPDSALKLGVSDVLKHYPVSFVTIDQFNSLVRFSGKSSCMHRLPDKFRKYGIPFSPDPLDQFVAASLKRFDRPLYDSLKGYTKVPRLGRALHTLLKFSRPIVESRHIRENKAYSSAYTAALNDVRRLFKAQKFDTLALKDMFKQLPTNTAAGYPYFSTKSKVLDECRLATTRNYLDLTHGKRIVQQPCLLALRGHLSTLDKIKTRPIWINSFDNITLENMLFRNVYSFAFEDPDFQNFIMTGPDTLQRLRDYLNLDARDAFFQFRLFSMGFLELQIR